MTLLAEIAPPPANIADLLGEGLSRVLEVIGGELNSPLPEVQRLAGQAQRYHGKMLRPALAIVAGAAINPDLAVDADRFHAVATAGAVIEIIHLATLVHDDVLDEAETRRGGQTINMLRGNEAAVILGDYLISKAFRLCASLPPVEGYPTTTAQRVGEITSMVCEGELLQLAGRGDASLSRARYFEIIERKTAALIAVAAEIAARHAGATPDQSKALYRYGLAVGSAFQIQDDLLDLTGNESAVGKPLGRDLALGKLTLPIIHHLDRANGTAQPIRDAIADTSAGRLAPIDRAALVESLTATGSILHAQAEAQRLVDTAKAELRALPKGPATNYLVTLADMVVSRGV